MELRRRIPHRRLRGFTDECFALLPAYFDLPRVQGAAYAFLRDGFYHGSSDCANVRNLDSLLLRQRSIEEALSDLALIFEDQPRSNKNNHERS